MLEMKAALLTGQGNVEIRKIEKPIVGKGEVLVKVRAAGLCGSDLPRLHGMAKMYPIVLGHEFSGIVEFVGQGVMDIKVGDHVAVAPLKPCHCCKQCLNGDYALCSEYSFIGSRENGAFAEYVVIPEVNALKLDKMLPFVDAAFIEPISVAIHGLLRAGEIKGKRVGLIGLGTIGFIALQCLKAFEAGEIIAFDIDVEKNKRAMEYGASAAYHSQSIPSEIYDALDVVFDFAGAEASIKLSMSIAGPKGQVIFVGTPSRSITLDKEEFEKINRKELSLHGSWMSYSAPFPGQEWCLAAKLLFSGAINVNPLIEKKVTIDELPQVMNTLTSLKGKIIMEV